VQRPDLDPQDRRFTSGSHRPDAQLVARVPQAFLERRQFRYWIGGVQRAKELFLGLDVACASVTADGDSQDSRRAAFPLCFANCIQHHAAYAFQVAPGLPLCFLLSLRDIPPHVVGE